MWLNRVMDAMRATVRHELSEAVVAYEEKPRDQWLFDYPAQVALCGTQIWWTTEVVLAFGRLEEGYENALKDYYKKQVLFFKSETLRYARYCNLFDYFVQFDLWSSFLVCVSV